ERLKVLGGPAERGELDGVLARPGEDVLVAEALLPVDGRRPAEVGQVVHLAIPRDGHPVGDRVLAVPPPLGPAGHDRVLVEVVAGVAEVAAGVVDPRLPVLSGRPALERDPHRYVDVGPTLL